MGVHPQLSALSPPALSPTPESLPEGRSPPLRHWECTNDIQPSPFWQSAHNTKPSHLQQRESTHPAVGIHPQLSALSPPATEVLLQLSGPRDVGGLPLSEERARVVGRLMVPMGRAKCHGQASKGEDERRRMVSICHKQREERNIRF